MPSQDQRHGLPGCYYRDSDFCFLDDMSEGDYIDLSANPERFTGYAGPSARRVWASIYEENCFGMSEFNLLSTNSPNPAPVSLPDSMTGVLKVDGNDNSKSCLEKRIYYKIISGVESSYAIYFGRPDTPSLGLHASISTHVCHEDMNQTTGEWGPNLQCFINRVAAYPERLQYIYFNVVLLLRAVSRIGPYLSAYDYCGTGTHEDDAYTLEKLGQVVNIAQTVGKFDETVLFRGENANVLKEEFKAHFRNVSRIMDCVGCDKCRLWGKVQTSGIGTALKILFELDEKALDPHLNANLLSRSEVVALINTLHRFSESLAAVNDFRKMWADAGEHEAEHMIKEAEKVVDITKPRPSPHAGTSGPSDSFIDDFQRWVRACQEGTVFCIRGLVQGVRDFLNSLSSLFQLSGKEGPPRSEF
ncbi:hypothetical protein EUX98_g2413 [Antrodiella citrinella]|uniref:Endoplasmic reticulum oxidoreductin 1 n=1 Tax=Antrodiella citrinella TaxID=2447956 RepID=A0A4S4N1B3_9APHY|nr:hypothetical protein EUX98_g2413 [Antrodiella citrinella]